MGRPGKMWVLEYVPKGKENAVPSRNIVERFTKAGHKWKFSYRNGGMKKKEFAGMVRSVGQYLNRNIYEVKSIRPCDGHPRRYYKE